MNKNIMLDTSILIVFAVLITLIGIRFGFGKFIGTFSSVIFLIGVLLVLISYFRNHPQIKFDVSAIREERSALSELYTVFITIRNNSDNHLYDELLVYLEEGTVETTDLTTELIPWKKERGFDWPIKAPVRLKFRDFPSEDGYLSTRFPLLVAKGKEQTNIKITLYASQNQYNYGLLAMFNPVKNYRIKDEITIELANAISNVPEDNKNEQDEN